MNWQLAAKTQKICLNFQNAKKHPRIVRCMADRWILLLVIKKNHAEKNKRRSIMRIFIYVLINVLIIFESEFPKWDSMIKRQNLICVAAPIYRFRRQIWFVFGVILLTWPMIGLYLVVVLSVIAIVRSALALSSIWFQFRICFSNSVYIGNDTNWGHSRLWFWHYRSTGICVSFDNIPWTNVSWVVGEPYTSLLKNKSYDWGQTF